MYCEDSFLDQTDRRPPTLGEKPAITHLVRDPGQANAPECLLSATLWHSPKQIVAKLTLSEPISSTGSHHTCQAVAGRYSCGDYRERCTRATPPSRDSAAGSSGSYTLPATEGSASRTSLRYPMTLITRHQLPHTCWLSQPALNQSLSHRTTLPLSTSSCIVHARPSPLSKVWQCRWAGKLKSEALLRNCQETIPIGSASLSPWSPNSQALSLVSSGHGI
jgi:hypothetical protein